MAAAEYTVDLLHFPVRGGDPVKVLHGHSRAVIGRCWKSTKRKVVEFTIVKSSVDEKTSQIFDVKDSSTWDDRHIKRASRKRKRKGYERFVVCAIVTSDHLPDEWSDRAEDYVLWLKCELIDTFKCGKSTIRDERLNNPTKTPGRKGNGCKKGYTISLAMKLGSPAS